MDPKQARRQVPEFSGSPSGGEPENSPEKTGNSREKSGAVPQPTALDPKQKKIFDLLIQQAMDFLLTDANARAIVQRASAEDPKEVVASAVMPLLQGQYEAAQSAGVEVEIVTLLAAGIQIVSVLAKMLEAAELLTEQEIPAFVAEVAKMAVEAHNAKLQGGGAPPQQPQQPGMVGPAPAQGA